jgi:hypothetical protein
MSPKDMAKQFIPSMNKNEMEMLVAASGHVGWYKCKNGHPYTVGNCTYPMEVSRCSAPGCNAPIGGSNHVAVAGAVRMEDMSSIFSTPGYMFDTTLSIGSGNHDTNGRIMRFMLHAAMTLAVNDSGLFKFINPPLGKLKSSREDVQEFIKERLTFDYDSLKKATTFGDTDLSIGLHLAFSRYNQCTRLEDFESFNMARNRYTTINKMLV